MHRLYKNVKHADDHAQQGCHQKRRMPHGSLISLPDAPFPVDEHATKKIKQGQREIVSMSVLIGISQT